MEFFIWPKSNVEKSSKEEMLWQDFRRKEHIFVHELNKHTWGFNQ